MFFSSCRNRWQQWFQWLSPFFETDTLLPYTFLALLNEDLFAEMISVDAFPVEHIPLDGLLARTLEHLKKSITNVCRDTSLKYLPVFRCREYCH